ncbi:MAG: hypothetical protein Q8N83_17510 [Ignavibacteria bacterium]|nr:hypothetical protein [Ignavibacteria bacterium]
MIKSVIVLSFLAVQIVFAQPFYFKDDSLSTFSFSTSYFDLIRTKNSTSNSAISFQKSKMQFETSIDEDKLFFSLETEKNIALTDNSISKVQFKTGQQINRLTVDNEFSFSPFFTEQFVRLNQIKSVSTIDYGGSFGFRNSSHWFEKFRIGYYAYSFPLLLDLRYEDSRIDINNMSWLSKIFYSIGFRPEDKTHIAFQYEKYLSLKNKNENPVFAVEDQTHGSLANFTAANSSTTVPFEINYSHGEGESFFDFIFSQNSFGSTSFTDALYNGVAIKSFEVKEYYWLPEFSIAYDFVKGSLVGNIQSWPFTSVLTSLVANRINYRLAGHVYFFTFKTKKKLVFSNFSVEPGVSVYQILPELTLDNWQPSYLVFGVKDFTRNILPVRKAVIGKLAIAASYRLNSYALLIECGQFIPIKVIKKELPPAGETPGIILAQPNPSKTDGGRWISLSLRKSF